MFVLEAGVAGAGRLYAIIFIVVLVSVVLQGGLVPLFARLFRVPMRIVEPQPWASGLRFRERPEGMDDLVVESGSRAEGSTVNSLDLGDDGWISLIRREGRLVQVRGSTRFEAGCRARAGLGGPRSRGAVRRTLGARTRQILTGSIR